MPITHLQACRIQPARRNAKFSAAPNPQPITSIWSCISQHSKYNGSENASGYQKMPNKSLALKTGKYDKKFQGFQAKSSQFLCTTYFHKKFACVPVWYLKNLEKDTFHPEVSFFTPRCQAAHIGMCWVSCLMLGMYSLKRSICSRPRTFWYVHWHMFVPVEK